MEQLLAPAERNGATKVQRYVFGLFTGCISPDSLSMPTARSATCRTARFLCCCLLSPRLQLQMLPTTPPDTHAQ